MTQMPRATRSQNGINLFLMVILWIEEILHHQKDGWNPINNGMFIIYQLVQDFNGSGISGIIWDFWRRNGGYRWRISPNNDHIYIYMYTDTILRGMKFHKSQLFWCLPELQGFEPWRNLPRSFDLVSKKTRNEKWKKEQLVTQWTDV